MDEQDVMKSCLSCLFKTQNCNVCPFSISNHKYKVITMARHSNDMQAAIAYVNILLMEMQDVLTHFIRTLEC